MYLRLRGGFIDVVELGLAGRKQVRDLRASRPLPSVPRRFVVTIFAGNQARIVFEQSFKVLRPPVSAPIVILPAEDGAGLG
jgi:hypothetical protein